VASRQSSAVEAGVLLRKLFHEPRRLEDGNLFGEVEEVVVAADEDRLSG
jgi:hypothetical protein